MRFVLIAAAIVLLLLPVGCASRHAQDGPAPPLVIFFQGGARLPDAAADSIWQSSVATLPSDSVRVLKDPDSLARYGARGRAGVVLIYLKDRNGESVGTQ